MQEITVKLAETSEEMDAVRALRMRVFVEEQGVPVEEEYDAYDAAAIHAAALHDGAVVGAGRLVQDESGQARIGRMAVERPWRRHGVGGQVLTWLEERARDQGYQRVFLHAQSYVREFYAKHGYVPEGERFLEAGIEHVAMSRRL